ncbi:MAG: hypothetical protein MJ111_04820 [Clostridia bacterium]|nr:hypothetical protein [Candidatus Limimonas egerieequi]MCQ2489865.1 hypothetical protein [Clostridia bacterium]
MNEQLFRKKSLKKIESPESLNDYVRVASPSVWILVIALAVLLVGVFVWGTFGALETTMPVRAVVENRVLWLVPDDINDVPASFDLSEKHVYRIEGEEYETYLYLTSDNCFACETKLEDGSYKAELVVESIKPISFIFN